MKQLHPLRPLWQAYANQVLEYSLDGPELPPLKTCAAARRAFGQQVRRLADSSGAEAVALIGAGSGEAPADLAEALPEREILVLEPQPQRLRELADLENLMARLPVLADTSLRALWLLGTGAVHGRAFITCLNPELCGQELGRAKTLQRLLCYAPDRPSQPEPDSAPSLSLYLIAHPEEPGLEDFFERLPGWLAEVLVLWDSPAAPETAAARARSAGVAVRHLARPLGSDFSAQRNYALAHCTGSWVISLDADERLSPESWEALRAEISAPRGRAYLLPRLTLYPDPAHFRMGYGLWPDPQLRLFRREAGLAYSHPVHEILTGFAGDPVLLPHCPIIHQSYLAKNRAELRQRLEIFNLASGSATHRLSEDYPRLPLAWHEQWLRQIPDLTRLPLLRKA